MSENEALVRKFIEAWSRLDATELAAFFTEDGVYHNMPAGPIQGRANIEKFIAGFSAPWTETTWDLIHIASTGNLVFAERLDRTKAGAKSVDLPCLGVFEIEGNQIKVWRDYFDIATYQAGLA
ncbi:MAG: SgcJ/EcaC family oxidoreductase [Myxococcota bacterium]